MTRLPTSLSIVPTHLPLDIVIVYCQPILTMEKEPLLGELPREATKPKTRSLITAIRLLAFTFAASFAGCYFLTGFWPLDYVVYSPAERVLIRNPLIGKLCSYIPLMFYYSPRKCQHASLSP